MILEPTAEMVERAREVYRTSQAPDAEGQMRDVVAAVLAIIERDNEVRPYCNAVHESGVVCKRMRHEPDSDSLGGHYAASRSGQKSVAW